MATTPLASIPKSMITGKEETSERALDTAGNVKDLANLPLSSQVDVSLPKTNMDMKVVESSEGVVKVEVGKEPKCDLVSASSAPVDPSSPWLSLISDVLKVDFTPPVSGFDT